MNTPKRCRAFVTIEGRRVQCTGEHRNPRTQHSAQIVSLGGLFVWLEWDGTEESR